MKIVRYICVPILLVLPACTSGGGEDSAAPELADITEYYEVTGEGLWEGTWEYTAHQAAVRVLQPSTSTFTEQFVDLDEAQASYEMTAVVDLKTNTFTFAFEDGSYEGAGTFYGDAWDWYAWESTSLHEDGSSVVSQDTKKGDDIFVSKVGYDAEGQEQWTMEEVLTAITEAEWLALQESR